MGGMPTEPMRLAPGMKPREARRVVLIQARMRVDGVWGDVCIRNISSRGMLLQAASAPPRGTYVEIFRGRHSAIARVVWCSDRRFGIHTRERMDVDALINKPRGRPPQGAAQAGERRLAARFSAGPPLTITLVAQRLERSRRLSAGIEFGTMVAFALLAGIITLETVGEVLSRPFAAISEHL